MWYKSLLSFIAFVLLVGSLIAAVPQARAEIGQLLQRFGFILVEPIPTDQPSETLVTAEAEVVISERVIIPSINLDEAQKLVPFPIPIPSWVPEGLELDWILVGEGPHESTCAGENCTPTTTPIHIVLTYKPEEGGSKLDSGGLMIDIFDQPIEGGFVYPTSEAQTVTVNKLEAVYYSGAWQTDSNDNPDIARLEAQLDALNSEAQWNSSIDEQALSWQDEKGFVYVVRAIGLNLRDFELIRIAESIPK